MLAIDRHFNELTSKEREALELVSQHLSSKEIAQQLGVSPSAIDQRLDSARGKLGAVRRTEAARIYLALAEREAPCEQTTGQPFPVLQSPSTSQEERDERVDPVFSLGDAAPFTAPLPWQEWGRQIVPELEPARLGARARFVLIAWGALAIALFFAVLAGVVTVLNALI